MEDIKTYRTTILTQAPPQTQSEYQDVHNYVQNLLQLQGAVLRLKCIVGDHATSGMFWEAEEGGLALIPGHSHFQVFTVQGDDKLDWKQSEICPNLVHISPTLCHSSIPSFG